MRTRLHVNDKGMSLIIVLTVMAVIAAAAITILSLSDNKRKLAQQMNIAVSVEAIKQKLFGMVISPLSWQQTQVYNSDAFSPHLTPAASTKPPLLNIYAPNSTAVFYPSTNPKAGFDLKGNVCYNFSTQTGNDDCPLHYEISLISREKQNGNWTDKIGFQLFFSPSANSSLVLNPNNPKLTFNFVRNLNDESAEQACIAVNGIYDQATNSCTEQLTKPVAACPSGKTYRGPSSNTSLTNCDQKNVVVIPCTPPKVIKGFYENGETICGKSL